MVEGIKIMPCINRDDFYLFIGLTDEIYPISKLIFLFCIVTLMKH